MFNVNSLTEAPERITQAYLNKVRMTNCLSVLESTAILAVGLVAKEASTFLVKHSPTRERQGRGEHF